MVYPWATSLIHRLFHIWKRGLEFDPRGGLWMRIRRTVFDELNHWEALGLGACIDCCTRLCLLTGALNSSKAFVLGALPLQPRMCHESRWGAWSRSAFLIFTRYTRSNSKLVARVFTVAYSTPVLDIILIDPSTPMSCDTLCCVSCHCSRSTDIVTCVIWFFHPPRIQVALDGACLVGVVHCYLYYGDRKSVV